MLANNRSFGTYVDRNLLLRSWNQPGQYDSDLAKSMRHVYLKSSTDDAAGKVAAAAVDGSSVSPSSLSSSMDSPKCVGLLDAADSSVLSSTGSGSSFVANFWVLMLLEINVFKQRICVIQYD